MPQAPAAQRFVRMRPEAGPLASRLYGIVAAVDPTVRLSGLGTAADAWGLVRKGERLDPWLFMAVAAIVLLLSVAGIYALISFTVSPGYPGDRDPDGGGSRSWTNRENRLRKGRLPASVGGGPGESGGGARPLELGGGRGPPVASDRLRPPTGAGLAVCLAPMRRALAIESAAAIKSEWRRRRAYPFDGSHRRESTEGTEMRLPFA